MQFAGECPRKFTKVGIPKNPRATFQNLLNRRHQVGSVMKAETQCFGENQTQHTSTNTSYILSVRGSEVVMWACFSATRPRHLAVYGTAMQSSVYQSMLESNLNVSPESAPWLSEWQHILGPEFHHRCALCYILYNNSKLKTRVVLRPWHIHS